MWPTFHSRHWLLHSTGTEIKSYSLQNYNENKVQLSECYLIFVVWMRNSDKKMCVPAQLNRPWSLALWLPDNSLILFVITWDLFASKWDTCSVRLWIWDFKVFISPAFSWTSFVAWRMNVKYLLLLSTTTLSYLEMIHQITLLYETKN